HYTWGVADIAVIKETAPGKLLLQRAQNSGALTVTATIHNGGKPTTHTATIEVKEPAHDAWVVRLPAKDEKPEEHQFYARDDTYLIIGQSNAVATDFGKEEPAFHSEWIRTYGSMSGNPMGVKLWGTAVHKSRDAEKLQIGYWGMELGRRLVESQQVPICLIN